MLLSVKEAVLVNEQGSGRVIRSNVLELELVEDMELAVEEILDVVVELGLLDIEPIALNEEEVELVDEELDVKDKLKELLALLSVDKVLLPVDDPT